MANIDARVPQEEAATTKIVVQGGGQAPRRGGKPVGQDIVRRRSGSGDR